MIRSRLAAVGAAAAVLLLGAPVSGAAARSSGASYVALGDSYASGTGTRSYLADSTGCQRSALAYPSLIAAARGYALNLRACSGARIADVTAIQLSALDAGTAYVTLSVGGNDAGFADVLTECAQPAWMSDCHAAIDAAQAYIRDMLPGQLASLYGSIRNRAPGARVVVVGYPRIFNGEDCNTLTWFSPEEEARLNVTADLLNSTTATTAGRSGFGFADPVGRFAGHAVCDDVEWLNGLSNPVTESYHPNRLGHAGGYTPTVSPLLTGSQVRVGARLRAAAADGGPDQARRQRRYAAADARIEPERFVVPDLRSAPARSAAHAAGVDLASRESIDRTDRAHAARQAAAWRARAGRS